MPGLRLQRASSQPTTRSSTSQSLRGLLPYRLMRKPRTKALLGASCALEDVRAPSASIQYSTSQNHCWRTISYLRCPSTRASYHRHHQEYVLRLGASKEPLRPKRYPPTQGLTRKMSLQTSTSCHHYRVKSSFVRQRLLKRQSTLLHLPFVQSEVRWCVVTAAPPSARRWMLDPHHRCARCSPNTTIASRCHASSTIHVHLLRLRRLQDLTSASVRASLLSNAKTLRLP